MGKRKKDIIILSVILGLIVVTFGINYFLFRNQDSVYCEIYVDSELVEKVDLTKDRKFSIANRSQIVFEVKDRSIAFIESDCPDKVCIHSGYLNHNGQSATCLPNKTTIRIRSNNAKPDDPDIVAQLSSLDFTGGIDEKY